MLFLERLSVTTSVCLIGFLAGACSSPTNDEIAASIQRTGTASEENAEPEGEDITTSSLGRDDAEEDGELGTSACALSTNDPFLTDGAYRQCRRGDAWHCRRGHPGWRWVNWYGRRCCVRRF